MLGRGQFRQEQLPNASAQWFREAARRHAVV